MQILPTFMYKYCCVTFISSSDHGAHSSHVSHIVLNTNVLAVGVSAGDMWVFIYLFIHSKAISAQILVFHFIGVTGYWFIQKEFELFVFVWMICV